VRNEQAGQTSTRTEVFLVQMGFSVGRDLGTKIECFHSSIWSVCVHVSLLRLTDLLLVSWHFISFYQKTKKEKREEGT